LPQPVPETTDSRQIAQAFKAILKGKRKWQTHCHEAMEADDAKQWEMTMKIELDSIMKNETWILVPQLNETKVIKSRWVLRTKDNGMHKA